LVLNKGNASLNWFLRFNRLEEYLIRFASEEMTADAEKFPSRRKFFPANPVGLSDGGAEPIRSPFISK
jgi:hypothetical protein